MLAYFKIFPLYFFFFNLIFSIKQCCGAGAGRTFLLEPEPVKKFRLRAVAVWLGGTVVAK